MQTFFSVMPGTLVRYEDQDAVVLDFVDLDTVLVELGDGTDCRPVKLSKLSPAKLAPSGEEAMRLQRLAEEALPMISDKRWRHARQRLNVLRDILSMPKYKRGEALIAEAATKLERSPQTIYRLLERYEKTRSIKSLMRSQRADKERLRLEPQSELVVRQTIEQKYLAEKLSPASVAEAVQKACSEANVPPPHRTTVYRRIAKLNPQIATRAREGKKVAKEKYQMRRGAYPDVMYPLVHVQIDHTPADICIVDEVHRKPLDGSPTLTLCVDVHTRCVVGFSLALEAPSIRLAGTCMIHSILRKDKFLLELDVDVDWPCFGIPSLVMSDNASEFTSKDFVDACNAWGVEVRKRPKGAPNYAGLIESTFRTFLKKIHEVEGGRQPGKTQRSVAYDMQGRPAMTLSELRRWLTIFITKYYHQQPHSGLNGLPPIEAWRRGILGWKDQKGIGLPDQVSDELKLRIDFLPSIPRTVQQYGVRFAGHLYTADILRQWVSVKDPDDPHKARKFVVKYDPWDMTEIYFYDPSVGRYFPLAADTKIEHFTLWESDWIRSESRRENSATVNQALIYEGLDEMRDQVAASSKTTKAARRKLQRVIESKRNSIKTLRQDIPNDLPAARPALQALRADALYEDDDGPLTPLRGTVEAKRPELEP